jgi:poly(3-hydroxybutyrate) depolymerase
MRKVVLRAIGIAALVIASVGAKKAWHHWGPRPQTPEDFPPAVTTSEMKTAATHPMQYVVSLPTGWTPAKKWPVVITIGPKEWMDASHAWARVRDAKKYPFILVTPVVIMNAGRDVAQLRANPAYSYSDSVWERIASRGRCEFDRDGIGAVIADVAKNYNGQDKAFITGFSAGGHLAVSSVLVHPERFRGAAFAAPNYAGRCLSDATPEEKPDFVDAFTHPPISSAPERVNLPLRFFLGDDDMYRKYNEPQRATAVKDARAHGFANVSEVDLPRTGHQPLEAAILDYFDSLLAPDER